MLKLVDAGVVGFKCFMCPSGVDEFPNVNVTDIKRAVEILENKNTVLAVIKSHGYFYLLALIFVYFSFMQK